MTSLGQLLLGAPVSTDAGTAGSSVAPAVAPNSPSSPPQKGFAGTLAALSQASQPTPGTTRLVSQDAPAGQPAPEILRNQTPAELLEVLPDAVEGDAAEPPGGQLLPPTGKPLPSSAAGAALRGQLPQPGGSAATPGLFSDPVAMDNTAAAHRATVRSAVAATLPATDPLRSAVSLMPQEAQEQARGTRVGVAASADVALDAAPSRSAPEVVAQRSVAAAQAILAARVPTGVLPAATAAQAVVLPGQPTTLPPVVSARVVPGAADVQAGAFTPADERPAAPVSGAPGASDQIAAKVRQLLAAATGEATTATTSADAPAASAAAGAAVSTPLPRAAVGTVRTPTAATAAADAELLIPGDGDDARRVLDGLDRPLRAELPVADLQRGVRADSAGGQPLLDVVAREPRGPIDSAAKIVAAGERGGDAPGSSTAGVGTAEPLERALRLTPLSLRDGTSVQAGLERIVEHVQSLRVRGQDAASLRLTLDELGQLDIRVRTEANQAHLHIVVRDAGARDALEEQLPRLRSLLEQSGMNLGEFGADLSAGSQSSDDNPRESSGARLRAVDATEHLDESRYARPSAGDRLLDAIA